MRQHKFWQIIFFYFVSCIVLMGCTEGPLTVTIRFQEISGLKQGASVYLGENEIGQVIKIAYTPQGDYLVGISITPQFKNAATEDSKFFIEVPPSATGAKAIIIEQERAGGVVLKEGSTVQGSVRNSYLGNIFKQFKEQAEKAEGEFHKSIDELRKSIGGTSDRLSKDLKAAIEDFTLQLDSFRERLGNVPNSQEVQELERKFRQFADEFEKTQKEVQAQIRAEILPQLHRELDHLRQELKKEGREKELENIYKKEKQLEAI